MFFNSISKNFKTFFDPKIFNLLDKKKDCQTIYGECANLSVINVGFFVEGFENYSKFLEFYSECIDFLLEKNATIERITGLQIIAYYNYPNACENPENKACAVAKYLSQKSKEKRMPMGVAIDSGQMIVGVIGSSRLVSHAIIGDSLNITDQILKISPNLASGIIVTDRVKNTLALKDYSFEFVQKYSYGDREWDLFELLDLTNEF